MNYLFNGDASGLEEEEIQMVDQWEKQMLESGYDLGLMEPVSDEPYFSYYPAFGKGCNVYDVAIRENRCRDGHGTRFPQETTSRRH